ncbi:MAPEG family protein [Pelomonas sp. SE-A7]|uniref:MAPEG family protein n=1 Tax=Pelomonas sp. SE-A7 TaxID=3054953 RepID=UPI00259CE3A8|nr:MAPEG family protein [Pelomonas sp. SE-A7]MDM4765937.1 MAPEG family protein [Pelomonas sp. SE-A7]
MRMTLAHGCLIVACLLPLFCAWLAKSKGFGKRRRDGGFDNHNPRAWLARLDGWPARANAAQANSFEALPLFIAGVLAAQQMGAAQGRIDGLAVGFVLARLAYIFFYVTDKALLRSAVWAVGLVISIALFLIA